MCSYERPGWPGYRDLGFCDRYLGNREENFPIWTLQSGHRDELFKQNNVALTTYRPKWHNSGLVCISSLGVCELALLVKLQDSTELWQSRTIQVYVPPFWLCFLNSLRSAGLKFPIWTHHGIRRGNRANPVTGLIWRGPNNSYLSFFEVTRLTFLKSCKILLWSTFPCPGTLNSTVCFSVSSSMVWLCCSPDCFVWTLWSTT